MTGVQAEERTTRRTFELFARFVVRATAVESAEEPTAPQLLGLRYLGLHPDCAMGALASGLGISQPAATKLVERLEKRGLARRERRRDDKRKSRLRLTPRGLRLCGEVLSRRAERLRAISRGLDSTSCEALVARLQRLLERGLAEPGRPQELCLRCGPEHDPECVVNRAQLAACGRPIVP
jgi:DNA-binding MarR family transcriptional regulator